MAEFLTIGEPMAVFASTDEDQSLEDATNFKKFVAGAELNVAIGVQRLEHQSQYISAVGNDPLGEFIINAIQENGIDSSLIDLDSKFWTGFYLKQRVTKGDPSTFYFRKNSAAANFNQSILDKIDFKNLRIAHLSGIFAAISQTSLEALKHLNQLLLKNEIRVTFDPNLRPALWDTQEEMVKITNEFAKDANIVLPGVNEGEILMGSRDPEKIADFYLNQSQITDTVIVKLGPAGAFIKYRNGNTSLVSGYKVDKVIDTVGAGDGFAVGLISGLLEDLSIEEAVKRGCAVGALAVMSPGDNDGYPTPAELDNFYNQQ